MKITAPGLYPDLAEQDYRAQTDWLSVSGAKKLLPPSCPAKFKASLGAEEHKPQFDVGKAFHTAVLGDGGEIVVCPFDSWRSKEARAMRDAAYEAGTIPLLEAEAETVLAMAAAVKAHDTAPLLFVGGAPEVSAFWVDEATGVKCKARFDYLPEPQPGRRLIVPDLKSAVSVDPKEFARAAARYAYVAQDLWYCDALRTLGVADDPAFVFVGVEKDKPYLPHVMQFANEDDRRLVAAANDKARRIYRECVATDNWPGYPGITQLSLPTWHIYDLEELTSA